MHVPAPVEELYEAYPFFHQLAGQQDVVGKTALTGPGTVQIPDVLRFVGDIHNARGGDLHAEGHFVLGDARQGLRVLELAVGVLVGLLDGFYGGLAQIAVYAGRVV